jgi:hypothetical protein
LLLELDLEEVVYLDLHQELEEVEELLFLEEAREEGSLAEVAEELHPIQVVEEGYFLHQEWLALEVSKV